MHINHIRNTPAFSMLELIFVIVILGIVASIGSQMIVDVYDSYITQRAQHRSSIKTELAATQLANRLAYSIPHTVIGRKDDNITFRAIEDIPIGTTDYLILEWIAYDADSFGAVTSTTTPDGRRPVWSGYCDVNDSAINSLSTPGSRLSKLTAIINAISPTTKSISDTAVLFPSTYTSTTVGFWDGAAGNTDGIHPVSGNTGEATLDLNAKATRTIKEHYKLAWTAYAVVPSAALSSAELVARGFQSTDLIYDFRLYYDYQPWNGESYADGSSFILIRNVSVFKFTGSGNTIRFKICQRESIGEAFSINTCKEKAVVR